MITLLLLVALAGAASWAGTHHPRTRYLVAGDRPGRLTRRPAGPVWARASGVRPVLVLAGLFLLWPVPGSPGAGGRGPLRGPGGIFD